MVLVKGLVQFKIGKGKNNDVGCIALRNSWGDDYDLVDWGLGVVERFAMRLLFWVILSMSMA